MFILVHATYEDVIDRVCRNAGTKFGSREITQKKEYNIHNTAKILNPEMLHTWLNARSYTQKNSKTQVKVKCQL